MEAPGYRRSGGRTALGSAKLSVGDNRRLGSWDSERWALGLAVDSQA